MTQSNEDHPEPETSDEEKEINNSDHAPPSGPKGYNQDPGCDPVDLFGYIWRAFPTMKTGTKVILGSSVPLILLVTTLFLLSKEVNVFDFHHPYTHKYKGITEIDKNWWVWVSLIALISAYEYGLWVFPSWFNQPEQTG